MKKTLEERFWSKVAKTDGCWLWTRACGHDGYGHFWDGGKLVRAHRLAYEWSHGEIPEGLQVDHRCFQRNCVRPEHLRLVTNAQNHQNRSGANSTNATGIRGVSWNKSRRKYQAYVKSSGKQHHVGYFDTLEAAETAVIAKRRELYTHDDYVEWSASAQLTCATAS